MYAGIGWIILAFIYYVIYKKSNAYSYKISFNAFMIIGILGFIIGIINRIFFKSNMLEDGIVVLLIVAIIYIYYKLKRYHTCLKITDKLIEK